MYFTSKEKQAIQRLAAQMVVADGQIDPREVILTKLVNDKIGITSEHIDASSNMSLQEAAIIVKLMSPEERKFVCAYLGTISSIDNDVDDKEMMLWALLTALCDFPQMSILEAKKIIGDL